MYLPLLLLRPDLDSSQDSRKVNQKQFHKKPQNDEVIEEGESLHFGL